MVYLILGMHKSGTTLLAETLHKSGINMIEEEFDDDSNYKTGHKYERPSTNQMNKQLLKTDDMFDFTACRDGIVLETQQREKMKEIVSSYNDRYGEWGFKDPRTVLTYSSWKDILPKDHKIIVVYRKPSQIMSHVMAGVRRPDRKIIRSIRALEAWKYYNHQLLNIINTHRNADNCLVINYHDLMTNKSIQHRLSEFIDREVQDARRMDSYNFRDENNLLLRLQDTFARHKAEDIYDDLERSKVAVA